MVSKDQSIGGVIFILCVVIATFYLLTIIYPAWLGVFGISDEASVRFWIVAVPVVAAFVAIMAIGAWIGWTMATTPPPKPIEEITSEIESKKEESAVETKDEAKPPEEQASEEEKKPERKKKS